MSHTSIRPATAPASAPASRLAWSQTSPRLRPQSTSEKAPPLEKHKKYIPAYRPNDFFWGVGIEQETYLELSGGIQVPGSLIHDNHRRERYAVDYFSNYKPKLLKEVLASKYKHSQYYQLPLLINSHSFLHTDRFGTHRTTFERIPRLSQKFSGTTLFEDFQRVIPYFRPATIHKRGQYERAFLFDGDTIEFATQGFYKATVEDAVEELVAARATFLKNVHKAQRKLNFHPTTPIIFPTTNHPFAIYLTNKPNLGIFNNGTFNINLTIPTRLDSNASIADWPLFKEQHRRAIRLIQWIEPLLLSEYGSPDPCASFGPHALRTLFSAASQRCAVSRYIVIGTFDTDEMPRGKVLQRPATSFRISSERYGWYKKFYVRNAYTPQPALGFDINFNKHKNHGIEIRFFDSFPIDQLLPLLHLLVYILDLAVETPEVPNPIACPEWNNLVADVMRFGKNYLITEDVLALYRRVFGVKFTHLDTTAGHMLATLRDALRNPNGLCAKRMIRSSCWSWCA